jgi:hypothetical protein
MRAMRVILSSCVALLLALAHPPGSAAQLAGTIDLGTGPAAWDQRDGRGQLVNGAIGGGYRFTRLRGLEPELWGDFDLSSRPAELAAVGWDLGMRLHTTARADFWLGASIGAAGSGSRQSALTTLEGGVRRTVGPARVDVWVARTGFGSSIAPGGGGLAQDSSLPDTLSRRGGVTEYVEVGSRAALRLSRYELGLSLTQRMGSPSIRRTGWELSATWWFAPSLGIVGSTGHSLPQFGFTVPAARYGTVGIRLAVGARSPVRRERANNVNGGSETRPMLLVSNRRLTIKWARARTVEVMGDFTDWSPRPLIRLEGGRWTLPTALGPGMHHLNVRFDGGSWLVPSGAYAVDDGFGGRVGMVVVR